MGHKNMKAAVITVAGVSSRFNEGIPENQKVLKAIHTEGSLKETLLYHMLEKCAFAELIVIVGGYKFDDLAAYVDTLDASFKEKIKLVFNEHYEDLGSGYSLYLGLKKVFEYNVSEVLFVEGDLDIDWPSFGEVVQCPRSVLTYTYEPIYANKAVVLYQDGEGRFRYAFNSSHGLLQISEPFACILNSGQLWKFTDPDVLREANQLFFQLEKEGTNLRIIQNYMDRVSEFELIGLKRWTNCNTRNDYNKITTYWEEEK